MQGLWSRAASSRSSCRCVSCLSTTANGVTSRSAAAASKRRLRIGNSVTALYTSIFAAAALADARAKAQRRHDWEEKIAAVKAEVNELVDEEQRLLESLQSRKNTRSRDRILHDGTLGITSNFTSLTRQRTVLSQPSRSFHTQRNLKNVTSTQVVESFALEEDLDNGEFKEEEDTLSKVCEEEDIEDMQVRHQFLPSWVFRDPLRVKAIQKLALKQFAIRMLLRPTIAHRYSGLQMNYTRDFDVPQINVQKLLDELNSIRRRITDLRTSEHSKYRDVVHEITELGAEGVEKQGQALDDELEQDLQAYISNQMSLEETLLRVAENLLKSVDPDRTKAFRLILQAFSQTRQNDINELLLRTLLPHRFHLSTSLIITVLNFYRRSKNLKDFDLFLQMLTGEGWSANLGALAPYVRRKVNGLEVVVPPMDSNNVLIYSELIICALRFNQPDRADAWLQAARRVGFFDNFNTLFSYIKFYSIRQDWEKGSAALKRAVTYLVSSTGLDGRFVERLIVLMSHLCDSCGRKDVTQALISAAMNSGFHPDLPSIQEDVAPLIDPEFMRWTEAAKSAPKENAGRPLWQKCSDFAYAFGNHLQTLEASPDDTRSQQLAAHAARHAQNALQASLSSTSAPQPQSSGEVTALKEEVAQLRELVFELRKHHIEASFKRSDSNTPSHHDSEKTRETKEQPSSTKTPNPKSKDSRASEPSLKFHKASSKSGQSQQGRSRRRVDTPFEKTERMRTSDSSISAPQMW
ncbi:hypothetical protein N7488_011370 [Penicillium malachiteum]|nr:hypothetical protein N7488_011370 [Penicillium malachiteum]